MHPHDLGTRFIRFSAGAACGVFCCGLGVENLHWLVRGTFHKCWDKTPQAAPLWRCVVAVCDVHPLKMGTTLRNGRVACVSAHS